MISVCIRTPKHPEWVDKIAAEMTPEEIEYVVKTTIYMNMDQEKNDTYKVSRRLREQANRTDCEFEAEHAIWILLTACSAFTYFTMEQNGDPMEFMPDK